MTCNDFALPILIAVDTTRCEEGGKSGLQGQRAFGQHFRPDTPIYRIFWEG